MKKNRFLHEWDDHSLMKTFRIMQITVFLLLATIVQTFANDAYSQKNRLSLDFPGTKLVDVLDEIESKTEFYFLFNEKLIDTDRKVNMSVKNEKIDEILDQLFAGTDVVYTVTDRKIILAPSFLSEGEQQQKSVSGKVTDESGDPLPGVTVVIKGTVNGTITDMNGNYSISNVPENATLQFSFIGMQTKEIVVGNQSAINIQMKSHAIGLDEVVAVGYGVKRKSDLSSAVSNVDAKVLEKQPTTSVADALQGRSSGVQITKSSGSPGGEIQVRIRGSNSITGNNNPLYIVDGFISNINAINPNDIASVDILKDASATAIYGSRGANGVILVTTKKGKAGTMNFNFEYYTGISNVSKRYELLDAATYAELANEYTGPNTFTDSEIADLRRTGGTDWQDSFFQTGINHSFQMSASGGSENIKYYFSGNYNNDEGVLINTGYEKMSIRSNTEAKISNKLKATFNVYGTRRKFENISNNRTRGGLNAALGWDPTVNLRDEDGNYILLSPKNLGHIEVNPIAVALESDHNYFVSELVANGALEYSIAKGLDLNVQLGGSTSNTFSESFTGIPEGSQVMPPNSSFSARDNISWQNTNILTYKRVFQEKHSLNLTAVFEQQHITYRNASQSSNEYALNGGSAYTQGLGEIKNVGSSYSEEGILSYVGRADYSYKTKYIIGASVRVDGSSKFRKENRYSTFPSASLAWKVSEESFLKDNDVVSTLKIRGSYGVTGNQAIGAYSTYPSLSVSNGSAYPFDGTNLSVGTKSGNPGNPDLKWETTRQTNLGVDASFFNNRININVDVYDKLTDNLLLYVPLPKYTGISTILQNVGEVSNKGIEANIGGVAIDKEDLKWNVDLNLSYNKNEVTKLFGDTETIFPGSGFPSSSQLTVVQLGESLGQFYGFEYLGTWKSSEAAAAAEIGAMPGDSKYSDEQTAIGNAMPDYVWNLSNSLSYKNFELSFLLMGVMGSEVYNQTRALISGAGGDVRNVATIDALDRWTPSNETDIPALSPTNNHIPYSSRFIEDGTFIRLRNLLLSYSLSQNKISGIGLSRLMIYGSVQNLFTITNYSGYDPEASVSGLGGSEVDRGVDLGAYPNSRTFTFGLKVSF